MQALTKENIQKLSQLPFDEQKDIVLNELNNELSFLQSDDEADGLEQEISGLINACFAVEDATTTDEIHTVVSNFLDIQEGLRDALE